MRPCGKWNSCDAPTGYEQDPADRPDSKASGSIPTPTMGVEWDRQEAKPSDAPTVKLIIQPDDGSRRSCRRSARRRTDRHPHLPLDRDELDKALEGAVSAACRCTRSSRTRQRGDEKRLRKLEQRLLDTGAIVARTADDPRYHGKMLIVDDTLLPPSVQLHKARHQEPQLRHRHDEPARRRGGEALRSRLQATAYTPSQSSSSSAPRTRAPVLTGFIAARRRSCSSTTTRSATSG